MEKQLQRWLLIMAMMLVPWVTQGQDVRDYTLATGTDSTMWITLSSTATHITTIEGEDDEASSCINIGFTFNFGGNSYTQFSCNSNGRIRLGSTPCSYYWNMPFTTLTDGSYNDLPFLSAFGMDNTLEGSGSYVKYELTGTAPNRILVIEYSTPSEYDSDGDIVHYQVQLLEDSSKVRFVYGTTAASYYDDYQIGLAATAADYLMVSATSHSTVTSTTFSNSSWPGVYRYYEFTPFLPTCPRTSELVLDSLSQTSATFHWTEMGSATSWVIEYDSVDFVPGAGMGNLVTATTTSYTLTGLDSGRFYYVYLHADCGGGDTSLNRSLSFFTPLSGNSLPFVCGFESVIDSAGWEFVNGSQVNKWYIGSATNNGGNRSLYVSNDNGASNAYTNTSTVFVYAYKEFTLAAGGYAITYDWKAYGESNYDYIRVFLAPASRTFTAGQDPTGGTSAYSWSSATLPADCISLTGSTTKLNLQSSWQNVFAEFAVSTPGDYKLVFAWANDGSGGSTPPGAIDNIVFMQPTCPRPADMSFSGITPNSFDVSWVETGSASTWVIEVDSAGTTVLTDIATDTNYSVYGRGNNTVYTVRVAALCGDGDTSMWLNTQFRTPCSFLDSLPYFYGFEDSPTGSNSTGSAFAYCYTRLNNGTSYGGYPYVSSSSTYNHTPGGSKGLYWYNTTTTGTYGDYMVVVLPGVDTDYYPARTLQLRFWAKPSSTSYSPVFYVGVMTNPNDINTFVYVDTIQVSNSTVWQEFESNLNRYEGSGNYVAIRANRASSWYAYVDDITLTTAPTCPRTSELEQTDATLSTITISWTEQGEAEQWVIEYDTVDFVPGSGAGNVETVTSIPHTLTGLDSAHNYYIYLHADCYGDTSENRFLLGRTLAASPAHLPYFCDFEGEGPNGWNMLNGNQTNIW